ncbi:hypothetical protein [Stenotrophomonas rhizophila]|uniref:hypothetical protein n=1 Tax=Stenotrophomonas rhizophila TaxID=216778 RepID=UPI001E6058D6|nr:hypothetical protein [Stenotrophomonas rhizophila]MCC7634780.1 hypothetical protein [Stenotrophomonas rhizophila]MCC7665166.1 hypothetical protein [Stenotrophomonas rhizophila]
MALVALLKLVDFLFYGGRWNDLLAAVGFALLLLAMAADLQRSGSMTGAVRSFGVASRLAAGMGSALVVLHFLIKWQVPG